MRAAVAAEDAKRQRAVDRRAAEQGETRWRLSVREAPAPAPALAGLAVQEVSFAELDAPGSSDEEEEERPRKGGRSLRVAYGKVRAWECCVVRAC
jgi:hypothetical protein